MRLDRIIALCPVILALAAATPVPNPDPVAGPAAIEAHDGGSHQRPLQRKLRKRTPPTSSVVVSAPVNSPAPGLTGNHPTHKGGMIEHHSAKHKRSAVVVPHPPGSSDWSDNSGDDSDDDYDSKRLKKRSLDELRDLMRTLDKRGVPNASSTASANSGQGNAAASVSANATHGGSASGNASGTSARPTYANGLYQAQPYPVQNQQYVAPSGPPPVPVNAPAVVSSQPSPYSYDEFREGDQSDSDSRPTLKLHKRSEMSRRSKRERRRRRNAFNALQTAA